MNQGLSLGTLRRITALFPASEREEVAQLLVAECGENLPSSRVLGPVGVERIRFAVLKLSGGSLDRLRGAVAQAQGDWRDSLVAAGFGGDDLDHPRWRAPSGPIG